MAKKKTTRRVPPTSTPRMYGDGKPSQAVGRGSRQRLAPEFVPLARQRRLHVGRWIWPRNTVMCPVT